MNPAPPKDLIRTRQLPQNLRFSRLQSSPLFIILQNRKSCRNSLHLKRWQFSCGYWI